MRHQALAAVAALTLATVGCAGRTGPLPSRAARAEALMLPVPPGDVIFGSTPEERERAYADARRTAGDDRARQGRWFEREEARHTARRRGFLLDRTPVTQAMWAEYVAERGGTGPCIDAVAWRRQGYVQDFEREVARMCWTGATPPAGRDDHPVVLVTQGEAAAYCAWRGRRLPTAEELEHAMRGTDGRIYPWGDRYEAARLASADSGPGDTEPVGTHPYGAGPYGHLDLAGDVFAWTSTPWPFAKGEYTVKGSAWDDHGGVGRGASRHGRPARARHVIVGFRCAGDP